MKIVCDACSAKYSIADEKVKGKVFKIRCKKCSNIIVVRGGAGAADSAPQPAADKDTRVYDYGYEGEGAAPPGDDAVCHVVIDQEQVGPISVAEVSARFAAGEIIHSDISMGFIRAEVVPHTELLAAGSLAACRQAGTLRLEGTAYPVRDDDVVHYRFNV